MRWYVREIRPLIRNAEILDRLFITKTGSPYTPNKMSKKISLLLTRYGFPSKTAHSMRHYFCSDLFRRGAKLHEVQAMMRHRDVRSTMVYSHVTIEDLRSAVNRRAGQATQERIAARKVLLLESSGSFGYDRGLKSDNWEIPD